MYFPDIGDRLSRFRDVVWSDDYDIHGNTDGEGRRHNRNVEVRRQQMHHGPDSEAQKGNAEGLSQNEKRAEDDITNLMMNDQDENFKQEGLEEDGELNQLHVQLDYSDMTYSAMYVQFSIAWEVIKRSSSFYFLMKNKLCSLEFRA